MSKKAETTTEGILSQWKNTSEDLNGKMYEKENNIMGVKGVGDVVYTSKENHTPNNANNFSNFKNALNGSNSKEFSNFFLSAGDNKHYDDIKQQDRKEVCLNESNYKQGVENGINVEYNIVYINGNNKGDVVKCNNSVNNNFTSDDLNDMRCDTILGDFDIAKKMNGKKDEDRTNNYENNEVFQEKNIPNGNIYIDHNYKKEIRDVIKMDNNSEHPKLNDDRLKNDSMKKDDECGARNIDFSVIKNDQNSCSKGFQKMPNDSLECSNRKNILTNEFVSGCTIFENGNGVKTSTNMLNNEQEENIHIVEENKLVQERGEQKEDNAMKEMHVYGEKEEKEKEKEKDKETKKEENVEEKKEWVQEKNGKPNTGINVIETKIQNITTNCVNNQSSLISSSNNMNCNKLMEKERYDMVVNRIIDFHKNEKELNLNRGELYLTEDEYVVTSYLLMNNGFRFFPCEEVPEKLPRKRKTLYNRDNQYYYRERRYRSGSMAMYSLKTGSPEKERDSIANKNYTNSTEIGDKGEISTEEREEQEQEEPEEIIDDSEEGKERKELFDEILNSISTTVCDELLHIENSFKQLKKKIENDAFTFTCIIEKIKKKRYKNILFLYNDIYLYFNNLLYLSKPSSQKWMRLHEISVNVTNTVYNIQKKKERLWEEKKKEIYKNKTEYRNNQTGKCEQLAIKDKKNSNKIEESEKEAFQKLLTRVHQDVHFELYMKFKDKAAWKTLDGGEIELDDRLTDVCIFREMYAWCKEQSEIVGRNNEEIESNSSTDSY